MSHNYLNEVFSGATKSVSNAGDLKIEHVTTAKKVTKRWGEERWLVAEGAPFGFKIIHILAGQKTSLQYHERKEEANLVLTGSGVFFYANEQPNERLKNIDLSVGDIVHILPGMVHRIEARTDITLVEVSTPELDDVIRLEDDWSRGNGRIESEHSNQG
ncbi:cupin domain-containing protein [Rhizobium mongolense]|uniref:Mannose-6-phosphate isomerase-like protein (Cupin superfamily) n=1 Tax=Rhizobium mongolense TaxID=57676 RepID=A0A7W6RSC7_9HYPH|nr:cupin domain-containing protein [Rhizobium mongolense]MBB4277707.1 mannose-6-phosphate isomerase-like protein (cupin superfamily) [Rhizobium mongolense]